MKLGFIGLGQMGKPMALNLLKSGAQLRVYSTMTAPYAELEQSGAQVANNAQELAQADVIFLCLPHSEAVHEVLFGSFALAQHLGPGKVVVDTSTIAHQTTLEVAHSLKAIGVSFMDAPVSGMEARAVEGTLTIMCGGERTVFQDVEPLLRYMGNNILFMGDVGSGQLTKLINQLLFDINCAALGEVLPMAVKMGLNPEQVGQVVNSGTGKSYASEFFIPRLLQNNFSSGYPMGSAYKDLVSAAQLSTKHGIPMPVLAAATASYQTALLQGHGGKDKGAMILPFEALLGVQFRHNTTEQQQ